MVGFLAVREGGVEPPRVAPRDPKSTVALGAVSTIAQFSRVAPSRQVGSSAVERGVGGGVGILSGIPSRQGARGQQSARLRCPPFALESLERSFFGTKRGDGWREV
jgi:hypothetical protein